MSINHAQGTGLHTLIHSSFSREILFAVDFGSMHTTETALQWECENPGSNTVSVTNVMTLRGS